MERLLPVEAREPSVPHSAGSGPLRSTLYTVLAVMLAAGVWVRFNNQIAAMAPVLAGPAALVGGPVDATGARGLIQIGVLPEGQTSAAVAAMGLPPAEANTLTQALQRGRLRLAHLPLIDDTPGAAGGAHVVEVSAGGYTRQVMLTRQPTVVTLPIGPVATVSFSTADPNGVGVVALTLAGPMRLPDLQAGQGLALGVIAQ